LLVLHGDSQLCYLASNVVDVLVHDLEVLHPREVVKHLLKAQFVVQVSPAEVLVVLINVVIQVDSLNLLLLDGVRDRVTLWDVSCEASLVGKLGE
jgi:hypothetical protein